MDKITAALQVLQVGVGISVILYWAGILLGKIGTNGHDLRWWATVVVPQGIVVACALRIFKIF